MMFDEKTTQAILDQFNIGNFQSVIGQLESGFQSTNYHIQTTEGEFAIRIIHDNPEDIEFGMIVHEYLANHGIKTPKPMRSKLGKFAYLYDGNYYIIQTFIPGTCIYEPLEKVDPLLPFYGKKLGRIHSVLLKMNEDFTEDQLKCKGEAFSWMKKMGKKYMPDNDYVRNQYDLWKEDMKEISNHKLTMGIQHGDVGPKDFFFENGIFTGIMDFNATQYGYFLSDVVSMMMYCDLINEERMDKFRIFMKNYLKTAPVEKEELLALDLLLRARWFIQIFYHQFRYEKQITQGMENDDYTENLRGVEGGIEMLRTTNKYPPNFFYDILQRN